MAYLPYLAAMLRSIAVRSHGDGGVAVTVLHPGIAAADREAATPPGHDGPSVRWLEVDGGLVRRALRTPELPLPMYFRLLLGHVLPAGVARAIYLDADVIVDADLGGLWRRELGSAVAAAVVDYLPRCQDAIANWRELGLDGDAPITTRACCSSTSPPGGPRASVRGRSRSAGRTATTCSRAASSRRMTSTA